ncbi:MAG TPA: copper chaperone PCu(A)C [Nevskiaceae bacterium]|nr:copper chaperone PCu(A)C [Nevskiaceae bacterium]
MRSVLCGLALLLLAACGGVDPERALPRIESGWIRLPPPGQSTTAGYLEFVNGSEQTVTVVGAASPAFGAIEIHETVQSEGQMRMRRLGELSVAPGERLSLAPGGKHLMLFRPVEPLAEHQEVAISLALRSASGEVLSADARLHVQREADGHRH